jgi:hypothetical protein
MVFGSLINRIKGELESRRMRKRRERFKVGSILSVFVAHDVKLELKVIDVSEIDSGYIIGARRLRNLLLESRGIEALPFREPERLRVTEAFNAKDLFLKPHEAFDA